MVVIGVQANHARHLFMHERGRPMADFEVYVDDDRYSVPSLHLISAQSVARAKMVAEELWRASEHHQGVELRRGGERIFSAGSMSPSGRPASNGREATSA
jgi:hypothetical protein